MKIKAKYTILKILLYTCSIIYSYLGEIKKNEGNNEKDHTYLNNIFFIILAIHRYGIFSIKAIMFEAFLVTKPDHISQTNSFPFALS